MRVKGIIFLLIFFSLACSRLSAQTYSTKTGKVFFRSDAPLELIQVSSDKMYGKINPATKDFAFSVGIRSFRGFNSKIQEEHFNENYLESARYPNATFYGKVIEDINAGADGMMTVRAKGNLTIHNVTQERIIKVSLKIQGESIKVKSSFTVLLEEHNIPIPKVVHEKLASEIKVEIDAEMKK